MEGKVGKRRVLRLGNGAVVSMGSAASGARSKGEVLREKPIDVTNHEVWINPKISRKAKKKKS